MPSLVGSEDVYKRQGVSNPVVFVAAFVGVQGLIEAGFCFVVGSIVSKALSVALKRA